MEEKIGIIGFGNMGAAIAERIKDKYRVCAFDQDGNKTSGVSGIAIKDSAVGATEGADALILAVKPQDFAGLLGEIQNVIQSKLVISIAAGIPTKYIGDASGNARVVRVMPNLAAKIGQGMIFLAKGRLASQEDLDFSRRLFNYLGVTLVVDEQYMDAVTAVSGSGPGFLYERMEREGFAAGNVSADFRKKYCAAFGQLARDFIKLDEIAAKIVADTIVTGSIALLEQLRISPAQLKRQVASKGGTTEAGLEVLSRGGTLEDAVKAALSRAEELAK